MSRYREKIANQKRGYFRVADFEAVEGKAIVRVIAYLAEDRQVFDEEKDVLFFEDDGRQLPLNVTNAEKLIELFGDEPEQWSGQKVVLYLGSFGKENKPCIRLRAPDIAVSGNGVRKEATPAVASKTPEPPPFDDEIPF
jgi:hypothetical protein